MTIYDTTSETWKKLTKPGKCSVCYEDFCRNCPECLESRSFLTDACHCKTTDVCNKCMVTEFIARATPCTPDCDCGMLFVKCPVCRKDVGVGEGKQQWCLSTAHTHGLFPTVPRDL